MRFLILIIAIALLVFTFRALLAGPGHKHSQQRQKPKKNTASGEKMVPCAICKLHLPRSEALLIGDHYFCGNEHLQQWQDKNQNGH